MRNFKKLTTYQEFEKKLLQSEKNRRLSNSIESEYLLARSLIKLRLKNKLSQKKLAEKIGTKQPVISRLENMNSMPTFSLLQKIATALNSELRISFK